jgi:hypothetical protein
VLAITVLGSGISALDATVVRIALPAIGRDFGTGVAADSGKPGDPASVVPASRPRPGDRGLVGPGQHRRRRRAAGREYLISAASWRWIFFINIPVAMAVIVLSVRHVPESRDPDAGGTTDYPGAAAQPPS